MNPLCPGLSTGWLHAFDPSASAVRRGRRWLTLCLVVWAGVMWFYLQPHAVGLSWRECDTMAIARNFVVDGFDPLRPRVDWRGDTDGAVECEFPLYQALVAGTLAVFGEVEWPARLLSLLAMAFAALSLHRLLEWRTTPGGAIAGTLVFLWGAQAILLGARVQPDGLSTALALAGTFALLRHVVTGQRGTLVLAIAATTLAVLQKATALQIVAVQGLWVIALAPRLLRRPALWLGFAIVCGALGAWLWHGSRLFQETGLTFGVVGGGETKFPGLDHLVSPRILKCLTKTTMWIGLSPIGCVALGWLLLRRRIDRCDLALLFAVGAALLGSLRYSHTAGTGPHYHVFAAVAGAWCTARVWPAQAPKWLWLALLTAVAAFGHHWLALEREKIDATLGGREMTLACQLRERTAADELMVVRSPREAYDSYWRRRTNHECPAMHYQARRRGWVLPRDGFDPTSLAALRLRGADIIVDTDHHLATPELKAWLLQNADRLPDLAGAAWRLRPVATIAAAPSRMPAAAAAEFGRQPAIALEASLKRTGEPAIGPR
jgi:4-amino-4-deoxy-L-arabinose transferase-like glycosyltransferase